ncbi:hypothetical protein RHEph03_gp018 [Rhizobium phage RHEph03]|uniref:Uncharacterized protein n=3 Tax=Cuernavacavirus TaxID=2731935 RepID=A0A7S5QYM7_9CAUD|nr:hypothetical protein HOS23_gp13 [Rhizobium phage RHEph09]AGC35645.1 hypothetical protein RHEph03_gp018 [Rhizobium phage RHEph03]AGC35996.1 hypothetical protein RHEph09_gp013 [Rhizobium phage RHEph09]QIG68413.1 hypothetical protein EVB62_011 [Rhizobium phage RHph_TM33]QIG68470.1 hypothetical protein EVB63_011 [Rhizobium phage RHph_TM38]
MWTLLLNATGISKLWPYIIVALIVMVILVAAYIQGRSSGIASASTKQLNDWLNTQHREAKQRADIESMRTSTAREQLRKRWAKR